MRTLLYFLLLFACQVPPLYVFSEEYLTPKWYIGLLAMIVVGLYEVHILAYRHSVSLGRMRALSDASLCFIVYECAFSLRHLFGHGSSLIIGPFENPAPLALHLCMLLPLAWWKCRRSWWRMAIVTAVTLLTIYIVWLTESRAAYIALTLIISLYVCKYLFTHKGGWGLKGVAIISAITIIAMVGVYCSNHKSDSTSGRQFIAQTTWSLVMEHPIIGHGHGGFHRLYMHRQAEYFRTHPDGQHAWLADDITHPLNEFLYLWVDYGMAGPVLLLMLLVFPIVVFIRHGKTELAASLIPIIVFALLSYPLQYPLVWLAILMADIMAVHIYLSNSRISTLLRGLFISHARQVMTLVYVCCLLALTLTAYSYYWDYQWHSTSRKALRGYSKEMLPKYRLLSSYFHDNPYFLYNYMAEQYHASDFTGAIQTSSILQGKWAGYNLELLTGDILSHLHRYPEAIEHYEEAMYMCPVRFAPLEGQMNAYIQMGDSVRADSVARVILGKTVKVESGAVERIRNEARIIVE